MYQFTNQSKTLVIEELLEDILHMLSNRKFITSITGVIYNLVPVDSGIGYQTSSRNSNEVEYISKESALLVIKGLYHLKLFNTQNSRQIFNEAKIYKKRSPLFAVLLNTESIRKV